MGMPLPVQAASQVDKLPYTNEEDGVGVKPSGWQRFAAGSNPRSVTVGDFNGDGISDLGVANYSSSDVSVLLSRFTLRSPHRSA